MYYDLKLLYRMILHVILVLGMTTVMFTSIFCAIPIEGAGQIDFLSYQTKNV